MRTEMCNVRINESAKAPYTVGRNGASALDSFREKTRTFSFLEFFNVSKSVQNFALARC